MLKGVIKRIQLNSQSGYTLLELLVVILIVFILVALLVWLKESAN